MPRPKKGSGGHHRIYLRSEQQQELYEKAKRLGVSVEDLIKIRLNFQEMESLENPNELEVFTEAFKNLSNKVAHIELVLLRLCQLLESGLIDSAYVRGAIEIQAQKNREATDRAEQLEKRRLQTAQKIREEVNRYL
ncbi:MAG: hypothetical protein QNJ54_31655 [Prochloraceae cyanobacterium]|nr:hypothetical protein [Prochloraceae cyanobacterium]